jgi:transposase-like protein
MTDDTDICGHPTADGAPCQNPPSEGDHCWLGGHGGDVTPGRDREPPSKATQEQIASVIEDGGSLREASRKSGVHREQIGRWMEYGADEDAGPFQEFRDRLIRARGEGEGQYRKALIDIAHENDDTATLMAMLKQRYPESWGDVDRGEQASGVTVNVGDPDEHEIDPETLEVEDDA